jgi:hypothetical protein
VPFPYTITYASTIIIRASRVQSATAGTTKDKIATAPRTALMLGRNMMRFQLF